MWNRASTAEKVSVFGVYLVRIFLHCDWTRKDIHRLQYKCWIINIFQYTSIPYDIRLIAFREVLEKRESKYISTDDLIKIAKFMLENN